MFSPSQNTEFYRFGHKLALSPSNVQGRPLGMLSKLNPDTFFNQRLKARFGANTNVVMMNFFLPVLLQWTQIQNELNAETEKYGHINAPYHDEFRLLFGRSVPTVAAMVTHTLIEAGLDLAMLNEDFTFLNFSSASSRTPEENLAFRQSVVRQSDYALKLKSHYYANVVEKLHLPRRWTYAFVGPEASKEEVEVFSSPVSVGCAFEDHIKRYFLVNLADTLTFACGQVAMFIPQVRYMLATREVVCSNNSTTGNLHRLRHGTTAGSNNRRVTRQAPPSYVWKLPPTPTVASSLIAIRDRFFNNTKNLFLSAVGAAIGSFLAGGNGGACEYWCSRLFPYIVTSASGLGTLKQRINEVKKQIEDKTREIEEQQQRQQQQRERQQEPRQNSTNTNQHTSQFSEEELLQQEKEEEEERRRYFNETQALFAQRRAQQDDHVMNNDDNNNNNSDNNNEDDNTHCTTST